MIGAGYTWHVSLKQNLVIEPKSIEPFNSHVGSVSKLESGKFTMSNLPVLLAKSLIDYANTPVEERKDEVRFRVRLKQMIYLRVENVDTTLSRRPLATIYTESEWNEVRGYLPAYDKDNPMFEEVNDGN